MNPSNPYPKPDERDETEYEKQRTDLIRTFVHDLEELSRNHSGNYVQGHGYLAESIRHVNIIKFAMGHEEYMTETWHRAFPMKEEDGFNNLYHCNLFEAALEPFIVYLDQEGMERENRQKKTWVDSLIRVLLRVLRPRWFWNGLLSPAFPLSRLESMKMNLIFHWICPIKYNHR